MKNKKIYLMGAVAGVAANIATGGMDSWVSTIIVALIVGSLVGGISAKFIFTDNE